MEEDLRISMTPWPRTFKGLTGLTAFPDEGNVLLQALGTHQEASALADLRCLQKSFSQWSRGSKIQTNKLRGSTTIAGKARRDEWSQSLHPSCGAFELYQSSPGDVCPGQARHKMELLAMFHMCRGYAIRIGSPEHEWKAQVPNTQHIGQVMSNCCTSIVWWVIWL